MSMSHIEEWQTQARKVLSTCEDVKENYAAIKKSVDGSVGCLEKYGCRRKILL